MESSHSVPIIITDNELSETFTIQLCHTSSPLAGVCIQSTVTIVDNDGRGIRLCIEHCNYPIYVITILTIDIKHIEYDAENGVINVIVAILKGQVSPGYKLYVSLNTTLVFTGIAIIVITSCIINPSG